MALIRRVITELSNEQTNKQTNKQTNDMHTFALALALALTLSIDSHTLSSPSSTTITIHLFLFMIFAITHLVSQTQTYAQHKTKCIYMCVCGVIQIANIQFLENNTLLLVAVSRLLGFSVADFFKENNIYED